MSFISFSKKNQEHSAFSIIFFIASLFILITKVNCINSNISEIDNYNKVIFRYHQAVFNFTGLSKKMENIAFNIFLKINFKELTHIYEELKEEMIKLRTIQEKNESISKNIVLVDKSLKKFQKKYKSVLKTYNRFDDTKNAIKDMLKLFIIVMSIIVIIILIGIGIGSYFVIKNQRKYHQLQEEVSVRIEQSDSERDKETIDEEKQKRNAKKIYSAKTTEENMQATKELEKNHVLVESNNAISKELLKDNNKIKKII